MYKNQPIKFNTDWPALKEKDMRMGIYQIYPNSDLKGWVRTIGGNIRKEEYEP